MDDDYDDYEIPQPTPTFSGGSSGGTRGSNSRATASRMVASKSAIAAASRASAITMASNIHNVLYNRQPTNIISPKSSVNDASVKIAQKRSDIIRETFTPTNYQPLPPILPPPPPSIPTGKIPESTTVLNASTEQAIHTIIKNIGDYASDEYKSAIHTAHSKKQELLASFKSIQPVVSKQYGPVKYITYNTTSDEVPVNHVALDTLAANLVNILKSSDKISILNEFARYQANLHTSMEIPLHKKAIEDALANKAVYFTSDA